MYQGAIEDLTYLFANGLHRRLKSKIDASVYVTVEANTLYVKLTKFGHTWVYRRDNISHDILYGNSDEIVGAIVKRFRTDVLNTYFY